MKIVIYLLLGIMPVVVLIRDWKFSDKRTKKHHDITRIIIILWVLGSIGGTLFVWKDSSQIDELIEGKNALLAQNQELSGKIDKYQKDLNEKDEKINELEKNALKAGRGISSTYDFNGLKRTTTKPGQIMVDETQCEVFKNLKDLQDQGNYPEIIRICEQQITETPEWLTPYFFLGIAYANTGNKMRAIELLEYVSKNAMGYPEYKQADDFLEQLKK